MNWLKDLIEQIHLVGMGLVSMALVLASFSIFQPGDNAWILVYVVKPVPYFITAGIILALGLFLMIINFGEEK